MPSRRLIESLAASHQGMIRAALGGSIAPPEPKPKFSLRKALGIPEPRKCEKDIVWPTVQGGWIRWTCPGPLHHKGFHWDENYYPGYQDGDIDFFRRQYDILFGEDQC